jgi:hypothetical protein
MTARKCAWCGEPLQPDARADRVTCSSRCKKARQRRNLAQGRLGLEPVPTTPATVGQVTP